MKSPERADRRRAAQRGERHQGPVARVRAAAAATAAARARRARAVQVLARHRRLHQRVQAAAAACDQFLGPPPQIAVAILLPRRACPWAHHVPLWQSSADDAVRLLGWLRRHDALAQQIATNAQAFACDQLTQRGRLCYWRRALAEYSSLLGTRCRARGGRAPPRCAPQHHVPRPRWSSTPRAAAASTLCEPRRPARLVPKLTSPARPRQNVCYFNVKPGPALKGHSCTARPRLGRRV